MYISGAVIYAVCDLHQVLHGDRYLLVPRKGKVSRTLPARRFRCLGQLASDFPRNGGVGRHSALQWHPGELELPLRSSHHFCKTVRSFKPSIDHQ